MNVLEPAAPAGAVTDPPIAADRRDAARNTVVLEQPRVLAVIDHVRSHDVKCYWDFVECRWECPRG
jgi:hypothetical protein